MTWLPSLAMMTLVFCHIHLTSAERHWPWLHDLKNNPDDCLKGNGLDYRGTHSVSEKGRTCLNWSRVRRFSNTPWHERHNYCRNPNNRARPWCWVRRGRMHAREFCDIPQCETKPTETPDRDNEMTCGERLQRRGNKIVGGSKAQVDSQPWVASIFYRRRFKCGGTLIAPCWVLTASHCFDMSNMQNIVVYLGKSATNETDPSKEQKFSVDQLVRHENFDDPESYNNDIALLKIVGRDGQCAIRTDTVRTACLPPPGRMLPSGSHCFIAGYGLERSGGRPSQYLKEGQVQLISQDLCEDKDYYGSKITNNMFCAAAPNWRTDACNSDSGGPLVCEVGNRMFLFGIISWGEKCALQFRPGVYTRVSNYNHWIAQHTGLPSFTAGRMYPKK